MAARDHRESSITCPKCEAKGVVHFSDNDYPFMRRNDREIERVVGEFEVSLTDEENFAVTCRMCGRKFVI